MRTISEQTKQRCTLTLTQALTLVLTLTLSLDNHLALTPIRTLTESRLLREADAKYGWQLQKRSKEVINVKLQAQSRIGRLVTQKKTLSSELKAVTRSKHEAVEGAHRQYQKNVADLCDEVKDLRKLTRDELNTANLRHRDAVAKLEEQESRIARKGEGAEGRVQRAGCLCCLQN
jgi:hypothetical protein